MLSVYNNKLVVLGIKSMLVKFIKFRKSVTVRKIEDKIRRLDESRRRSIIMVLVSMNYKEIISIIKKSDDDISLKESLFNMPLSVPKG